MNESKARWRVLVLQVLTMAALLVLAGQLWRLQILHAAGYQTLANANRFRLAAVEAPRGVIYDRNGLVLARNAANYTISIVPSALPAAPDARLAVLTRLSQWLQVPVSSGMPVSGTTSHSSSIEEILAKNAGTPYTPLPIVQDVDKQLAFVIEEDHLNLPGVIVQVTPRREYPSASLTSHVVGYMGSIPAEYVQQYLGQPDTDYAINDAVGVSGLEFTYEKELRGVKGQKHVEVDAYQREVNILAIDPPQPGHNVVLTIDSELQRVAETALTEGMQRVNSTAGVVVVMDPRTGEIRVMVSLPTFDNNLFAQGISIQDYQNLLSDPERPLVNHAITGQYPPGSTFKIIPAAAGLQEKVIDRQTRIRCQGEMLLPNQFFPDDPTKAQAFKCWFQYGHGSLSILEGLAYSCDIFFYQTGGGFKDFTGLGVEKLAYYARAFGLGEPSGIALEGESAGLVPDQQWKRINYGTTWVTGDTYNATIGQGFILVTPLQLLNATIAVANGGTLYRPQLLQKVTDDAGREIRSLVPEVIRQVPVSAENLQLVREGMRYAVTNGTASGINLSEVAVAGKTGTAEYPGLRDKDGILPTHAWFTAFAPYDDPQMAVVVFVSGGHEGARIAVPVATQIVRAYFGLPQPIGEDIVGTAPGD